MHLAILTLILVLLSTAESSAKCLKGQRIIDNVTRSECAAIRGKWSDARWWDGTQRDRVKRPQ